MIEMRLYGCGYNNDAEKPGIWLFDTEDGLIGDSAGVKNPSYETIHYTFDGTCGGRSPRHFAISPDQSLLAVANQLSNKISVFKRNEKTGSLEKISDLPCSQPSCVIWSQVDLA